MSMSQAMSYFNQQEAMEKWGPKDILMNWFSCRDVNALSSASRKMKELQDITDPTIEKMKEFRDYLLVHRFCWWGMKLTDKVDMEKCLGKWKKYRVLIKNSEKMDFPLSDPSSRPFHLSSLGSDVTKQIFSYVAVQDLHSFMGVCKEWNEIFKDLFDVNTNVMMVPPIILAIMNRNAKAVRWMLSKENLNLSVFNCVPFKLASQVDSDSEIFFMILEDNRNRNFVYNARDFIGNVSMSENLMVEYIMHPKTIVRDDTRITNRFLSDTKMKQISILLERRDLDWDILEAHQKLSLKNFTLIFEKLLERNSIIDSDWESLIHNSQRKEKESVDYVKAILRMMSKYDKIGLLKYVIENGQKNWNSKWLSLLSKELPEFQQYFHT
eukprot:TRINITY_DN3251_c0_g1_i4.p1 TRINITY_DN3251_c0_g1~~TRINITY_DN3251_c0_g1_i4.p1  ORF type:complete len:381 (-),score=87.73 TRINITY_DN3251_c0_g1_i4:350-1492(-)